jgi:hypothetical protein
MATPPPLWHSVLSETPDSGSETLERFAEVSRSNPVSLLSAVTISLDSFDVNPEIVPYVFLSCDKL